MRRTTLRIFGALLALTLATSCPREERPTDSEPVSSAPSVGLDITIFSIGQADAMLVVGPAPEKRSLLIDLGTPRGEDGFTHSRVAKRIEEITGRRGVDYFMVSHFHEDHVGRHSKKSPRGIFGLLSEPTDKFRIGTWFDRGDGALEYSIRTRAHRHTVSLETASAATRLVLTIHEL